MLFETCCGSSDDVIQSELAGADRVELNSALFLGGLTPSLGSLTTALEHANRIKIVTMVRPRSGGFSYTDLEFASMLHDAKELLSAGSAGIVFGFLKPDGTVDVERCKRMLDVIGEKEAIFHRAFDVVPDWKESMEQLMDLGITRILTSGQKKNAYEGRETIRQMIQYAGDRIQILPGAGIREGNVKEIVCHTGCTQLHMSARKSCLDTSVMGNPEICFGNPSSPDEYAYEMMDAEKLQAYILSIRSFENQNYRK